MKAVDYDYVNISFSFFFQGQVLVIYPYSVFMLSFMMSDDNELEEQSLRQYLSSIRQSERRATDFSQVGNCYY